MNVLVVEDDEETAEFVSRALGREGMVATVAPNLARAEVALAESAFDVVILDVMLPDGNGLDLCRSMRARQQHVPLLFLSARGTVRSRLDGFAAGGDDYLAKPFAVRELTARLRALIRRGPRSIPQTTTIAVGSVMVDPAARRVTRDGVDVPLTAREWSVLELLLAREGRVVMFDELLDTIWGQRTDRARSSLEVIMVRLRKKVGADSTNCVIRNLRGVGYRLDQSQTP